MDLENFIKKDKSILIISSWPLDFDSIGSGLILKKYLESLNKKVTLVFPMKLTEREKDFYKILPHFDEVEDRDTREFFKKKIFDLLILLDGSNLAQFYESSNKKENKPALEAYDRRIHIDHHLKNGELGTHTIRKTEVSSTAEIIMDEIIPKNFIDEKIATLGYAAIMQDTGNFKWSFYSSSLKLAGMLLEKGAEPFELLERSFFSKTKTYLAMLKFAIENIEYRDDIATSFLFLPYRKMREEGINDEKLSELKRAFEVELAISVKGYARGIFIYEKRPKQIAISARGSNIHNKINLPKMLSGIGLEGGGHFNSCGFSTERDFKKVKDLIVGAIEEA
ncbi:MAG: DHH subfamily 1 protein [uncultured bacterium]|nr:MAG: DHH subfamily 1 protein [uncultured bacterium]